MGKKKAFLDKKNAIHYRLVPKTTAEAHPHEEKAFHPTPEQLEEQHKPKGETPEQRRLRKQAVKEARRWRRQEKKGNKMAFAEKHRKIVKERVGQVKAVPIV